MIYSCDKCNKNFKNPQAYNGHRAHHSDKWHPKYIAWNKGKHLSKEYKEKLSKALKGRKKAKMSNSQKENISKTIREKIKLNTWHNSYFKKGKHLYKDINFDSKWELAYAKWLDSNRINWRRPNEHFSYIFEGKEHYYTPDFYLIDENLYIEIKGYKTAKDEAKWKYFPLKLKVLQLEDIKLLNILGN